MAVSDLGCDDEGDDEIVTTFCDVVTARDVPRMTRNAGLVTKDMGEAKAPASGSSTSGGRQPGAGAALSWIAIAAAIALAACGGDDRRAAPRETPPAPEPSVADPAVGITTALDGQAPEFGDAIVAELTGDDASARAAFGKVLAAPDMPAALAARSALHLAQLEARSGQSRSALDLAARAAALAPNDPAITDGVARVQAVVVTASSGGELLGPRIGTPLPGVDARVAAQFAAAERALARVHAIRPLDRLAAWAKEDATEDLAAQYRAIADRGGLAQIAAEYRIGSLYRDLALGLLLERPGEQRAAAIGYLKVAAGAYKASLAGTQLPEAEVWRLAAETDLRSVQAVLAAATTGG